MNQPLFWELTQPLSTRDIQLILDGAVMACAIFALVALGRLLFSVRRDR